MDKTVNGNRKVQMMLVLFISALAALFVVESHAASDTPLTTTATITEETTSAEQASVSWLEPRGISVIELVGELPESVLNDLILHYDDASGVARYVSGSRSGNNVTIVYKVEFANTTHIPCLGAHGQQDFWNIIIPAGKMRVFDNGVDITSQVSATYTYYQAGQRQPTNDPPNFARYSSSVGTTAFDGSSISVPANSGCLYTLNSAPSGTVTVEYIVTNNVSYIDVTLMHEETIQMSSYIGSGFVGRYASLMSQLKTRFASELTVYPGGIRHDGWKWFEQSDEIKAKVIEANYFLVKFPPMDDGMYNAQNAPESGTYRQMLSNGSSFGHSVDHNYGMLVPLHIFWQETDQVWGTQFLPTHTVFERRATIWQEFDEMKSPEYAAPPGVAYHSCFEFGGCTEAQLQEVFNTKYDYSLYFYKVERVYGGLTQIPLKQVGTDYVTRLPDGPPLAEIATATNTSASPAVVETIDRSALTSAVYIPILFKELPGPDTPDPSMSCPCGWFDNIGRMWDIIP